MLGIDDEDTNFDTDVIININSALMILNQLGVGPASSFYITDNSEIWSDFLGTRINDLNSVKTYVYLKVRLVFDPPTNSFLVTSIDNQLKELEWRLNTHIETINAVPIVVESIEVPTISPTEEVVV